MTLSNTEYQLGYALIMCSEFYKTHTAQSINADDLKKLSALYWNWRVDAEFVISDDPDFDDTTDLTLDDIYHGRSYEVDASILHYIYSRARHGTGFWDASYWSQPLGEKLHKLALKQGSLEGLYLSDDGKLYVH